MKIFYILYKYCNKITYLWCLAYSVALMFRKVSETRFIPFEDVVSFPFFSSPKEQQLFLPLFLPLAKLWKKKIKRRRKKRKALFRLPLAKTEGKIKPKREEKYTKECKASFSLLLTINKRNNKDCKTMSQSILHGKQFPHGKQSV